MTMPDLDRLMQALECIHNGGKGDCERRECQYGFCGFAPCNVAEIAGDALEVLKEQEAVKAEEAEMYILHNDGTVEYVKDIDSIMLLASKDYGITYYGTFAKGR